jgi:hypothetical protein
LFFDETVASLPPVGPPCPKFFLDVPIGRS